MVNSDIRSLMSEKSLEYLLLWYLVPIWIASPVAQRVKNLPAMQDTWVQSLG